MDHKDDKTPPRRNAVDPERPETAVLSSNSHLRRALNPNARRDTASLGDGEAEQEVILIIRGMIERLFLSTNAAAVLGRADLGARYRPDIDLNPYGALDRGVSRAHARLHMEDRKLYVTDLGSTNGTFIGGKRLKPHEPELIYRGQELMLGRLSIQVMFK